VISAISVMTSVRSASSVVPSVSSASQIADVRPIAIPSPPLSGYVAPFRQAIELSTPAPSAVDVASPREFEVIVPPDQLAALTRLLETMRQQRMAWTPGPAVPGVAEPLPEPEPIDIAPIKIEPLPALVPAPGERKQL
jgi:hypothetical protein